MKAYGQENQEKISHYIIDCVNTTERDLNTIKTKKIDKDKFRIYKVQNNAKNIFRSQCYNVKYRLHLQTGNKRKEKNHHKKRLSEVQEKHKTKTNYVML